MHRNTQGFFWELDATAQDATALDATATMVDVKNRR